VGDLPKCRIVYDKFHIMKHAGAAVDDRGLHKLNFTRGGTFQPNSHRKTFTVNQYHPLWSQPSEGTPRLRSFIAQAWGSVCMYERHTGEPDWRNRMDETALYV